MCHGQEAEEVFHFALSTIKLKALRSFEKSETTEPRHNVASESKCILWTYMLWENFSVLNPVFEISEAVTCSLRVNSVTLHQFELKLNSSDKVRFQ